VESKLGADVDILRVNALLKGHPPMLVVVERGRLLWMLRYRRSAGQGGRKGKKLIMRLI
jgi:hypothetical protein